ncbi:MAG: type II toxin-antitoxin system prevent-host-death family antitoxin [Hyphomonadaceae bacterium]|nr:type II toxin-antitoxin system prevent-host-death family antitoxin [Hyphomonadaceae bacterium]
MTRHVSVAEAKANLSALINAALDGESIVITRHGKPVVALTPQAPAPGKIDLEWLARHRVTPSKPLTESSADLIRRMRDEETG